MSASLTGGHDPLHFKPYPAYKDSGVEWLGAIPAHWTLSRLRYLTDLNPSKREVSGLDPQLPVSFVPMEAVGEYGGLATDEVKPLAACLEGYTYFRDGDIVVAKITPCFENGKGALAEGLENGCGFGTTELHVLRAAPAVNNRFLFYLTLSDHFRRLGAAAMYGAGGQKRVPEDFIRDLKHPIPSEPEQRAIAAFLDRETAKIDALVAKKERALELLQEKRTALITQVVTRGLDPTVATKNSGVEWLGDIPKHWEARRLKRISPELTVGVVVNPSTYIADEGVAFLYGSDIREGRIIPETARRMEAEQSRALFKSRLHGGDLVMVRVGAPGVTAVVPPELEGANCASILIIRGSRSFDSRWLCYALNSRALRYQVELVQYGAAQEQFNVSHAVEFLVPCPPLEEQRRIANVLGGEGTKVDALIRTVQDGIAQLKEFRTALISAAVTGKIDVRNETVLGARNRSDG